MTAVGLRLGGGDLLVSITSVIFFWPSGTRKSSNLSGRQRLSGGVSDSQVLCRSQSAGEERVSPDCPTGVESGMMMEKNIGKSRGVVLRYGMFWNGMGQES